MLYLLFHYMSVWNVYCREEQEAKRLKEIEDKKREKLLNTKVPIGKPTNSAILKAEKVRRRMHAIFLNQRNVSWLF